VPDDARIRNLTFGVPDDSLPVGVCGVPGVYRAGLVTVLRAVPGLDVAAEFDGAGYGPRLLDSHRLRVLLVDLDGFGAEDLLARQLAVGAARHEARPVNAIALSSDLDSGTAMDLLRAGVQGFLHRDTPVPSLVEAIHAVDRGGVALDPRVARDLVSALRHGAPETPAEGEDGVRLTPRQHQILGLVGLGLTNVEIAERLRLGRPTVKTHISSLLRVLGLRDRTQLAVFACTHGITAHDDEREKTA
jgi:DNA-binding NarL/FixJ family response regulator